ncbi:hypothetical protein HZH66_012826 [Vespula vulgaris]|uniref:Uncharacterized protein n=1 Tax=Vespula vulgaris TaxID=7454 RepID=A0A834JD90_VESVU|nr:hypothetical protein HZH66_012826 [Vespula vulgaris]
MVVEWLCPGLRPTGSRRPRLLHCKVILLDEHELLQDVLIVRITPRDRHVYHHHYHHHHHHHRHSCWMVNKRREIVLEVLSVFNEKERDNGWVGGLATGT